MKCVICKQYQQTIGISINRQAICADCLMASFVQVCNTACAEQLNDFIVEARKDLPKIGEVHWICIKSN